jgi:3-hydroxyisobutyrate dehydrogenase
MNVGYIGLGIMGSAMAANLLRAGFVLTVWNRTASKTDSLVAAGARRAESPAKLASVCDVVCINVTDTPDVEAVLFGPDSLSEGAKRGLVVIDHSTISPVATRDFARRLAEQSVTLLDAPVSGGDVGARNATLSIMVGGDRTAFEACMPLFRAVGKTITHVGQSGAGQTCKACNQIAVLTTLAGVCEAVAFARVNGLDPSTMLQVVGAGAGGSWQLNNLGPRMVAEDFAPGFMVDLARKDVAIVLDAACRAGLSVQAFEKAARYLDRAADAGLGKLGTQAMLRAVASDRPEGEAS